MDDDYQEDEVNPRSKGSTGLVFVTISALLMAVAVAVLPWIAGGPGAKVELDSLTTFLGDLHPVVLHLPVGIFVLIFAMEFVGWFSFGKWKPQTSFPLFLGVVTAVVSVILGYWKFLQGDRPAEQVFNHMWGSIAFTVIAILAFVAKLWAVRSADRSPIYGILLLLTVGMMGYAGHEGGVLTHGDPFGPFVKSLQGQGGGSGLAVDVSKPVEERLVYEEVIVPIFYGKCYECHADADMNPRGKKKIKGKLVMTSMADLAKGGSSEEPAVTPGGGTEDSAIHYTIHLPMDDDEHMPPEDKPQLDANEIAIIDWWIASGAPSGKTMTEAEAPAEILEAADQLVPPEELRARLEAKAAEKARAEAEAAARMQELEKAVAAVSGEFPNALNYVSQESGDLTFTAVSMRKEFGDDDLAKLVPVGDGLVELEIGATSVTDAAMPHLAAMPQLRRLKLNETAVSDAALDQIAELAELEYLNLVGTAVTDEGIGSLAKLANLKKLYLWRSQVTKEGAAALNEALPDCEINLGWE